MLEEIFDLKRALIQLRRIARQHARRGRAICFETNSQSSGRILRRFCGMSTIT